MFKHLFEFPSNETFVHRSMNAYLVVYLCILISKAVINTVLKYVWQADPNRDEPWYNERTEAERQRHIVSLGHLLIHENRLLHSLPTSSRFLFPCS